MLIAKSVTLSSFHALLNIANTCTPRYSQKIDIVPDVRPTDMTWCVSIKYFIICSKSTHIVWFTMILLYTFVSLVSTCFPLKIAIENITSHLTDILHLDWIFYHFFQNWFTGECEILMVLLIFACFKTTYVQEILFLFNFISPNCNIKKKFAFLVEVFNRAQVTIIACFNILLNFYWCHF